MPDGTIKTIANLNEWLDWRTWQVPYQKVEDWARISLFETPPLSSFLLADELPEKNQTVLKVDSSESSAKSPVGIVDNFSIGTDTVTTIQSSIISEANELTTSKINIVENDVDSFEEGNISFAHINIGKIAVTDRTIGEIGSETDSTSKVAVPETGTGEINVGEIRSTKDTVIQGIVDPQSSIGGVGEPRLHILTSDTTQIQPTEIQPTEISFASSIPPEQFFSVHNSTPQIINVLNNSATNIWSDLLQSQTQLDIDFQIKDLPTGQLAEATITGFDDSGVPKAGTILIDSDANGVGWFIDETPLDNSEFNAQNTDNFLLASAESEANDKYDLLTTVLHELSHLYGFIDGYKGFEDSLETENGTTEFIGDDFDATLDGEHLDKSAHPYDLLNTHLAPGMRKLPSELDVEILKAILADNDGGTRRREDGENLEAALTSDPLLAVSNGNFEISDITTDSFAWDTRGASGIENGQAVLTEDSPFLSNFTQTFTVPEEAKTIQFKLIETELGTSELAPPDAFEVALLDANTNESLVTDNGLTQTDSLLNIQPDGTAYFSDKVRIGGATSGEIIGLDKSRTVTVDISDLTPGTEATLFFDLLGFGDVDSRVVIDDVRLSDQNLLPPVTVDDTTTTTQGQPVIIDILVNDTDDDGAIATDSVQIASEPINGTVTVNNDGTVTYTPGDRLAGEDSFTYTVRDNDAQSSEPAEVKVTVQNAVPEITEIQMTENITEGDEVTLSAIASDAGNDELTYTWEFDDGTTLDGQTAVRTYEDNGTYTGTLTVADTNGGSNTQAFEVAVANAAPLADAGEDRTVDEGSAIAFNGSFSDAGTEDTHTVTWDFGDGSELVTTPDTQTPLAMAVNLSLPPTPKLQHPTSTRMTASITLPTPSPIAMEQSVAMSLRSPSIMLLLLLPISQEILQSKKAIRSTLVLRLATLGLTSLPIFGTLAMGVKQAKVQMLLTSLPITARIT